MEIGTARDTSWRDYLAPESQSHGCRFNLPMLLKLIELYTKEGDFLLDPMAGVFSLVVAAAQGRHVYGIELESRFMKVAEANIKFVREKFQVQTATVMIQGDCRKILPLSGINCIITSPPYGTSVHPVDKYELKMAEIYGSTTHSGYGEHPDNIGNVDFNTQKFVLGQVYQKCYDSLVPGGRLVTVTKDSVKGGKVMEQKVATIRACTEAGFLVEAVHYRNCAITARQRKHQKDMADYTPIVKEDVVVFRRPEC